MRYSPIPNEAQTITAELWTSAPSATIMLQVLSQANLRHPHKLLPYKQHLRLFAASCTRRAAHLLADIRSRVAVQTAELFANGRASTSAMQTAYTNASSAIMEHAHTYSAFSLTQQTHFHPLRISWQGEFSKRTGLYFGEATVWENAGFIAFRSSSYAF